MVVFPRLVTEFAFFHICEVCCWLCCALTIKPSQIIFLHGLPGADARNAKRQRDDSVMHAV